MPSRLGLGAEIGGDDTPLPRRRCRRRATRSPPRVTFRAWLEPAAVRQVHGLPDDGLDELVRLMARICDDPYDAVLSLPVRPGDLSERMAEIAHGRGFHHADDRLYWLERLARLHEFRRGELASMADDAFDVPERNSRSGGGRGGRRAWDSNPRCRSPDTVVFKTTAIGH